MATEGYEGNECIEELGKVHFKITALYLIQHQAELLGQLLKITIPPMAKQPVGQIPLMSMESAKSHPIDPPSQACF